MTEEFLAAMETDLEIYETNVENFEYRIVIAQARVKDIEMTDGKEEEYNKKSAEADQDMDKFKNETEMLKAMIESFKNDEGDEKSTMDDVKLQNELCEIAEDKASSSIVELETTVEEIVSGSTTTNDDYEV